MPHRRGITDLTQSLARDIRRDATCPERILWRLLRGRRLAGLKFLRQVPIESFIVDFLCRERSLVIELDGDSHNDRAANDQRRQQFLESLGLMVLRIANDDVLCNLEGVLFAIVRAAGLDPVAWQRGDYGRIDPDLIPPSPPHRGRGSG
jgi:very-short-patch-repair endonuclease